jgi:8-oxo-dGTP pyrophosphatase MutT (NUDIX family)
MQPTLSQIVDGYLRYFADESSRLASLREQLGGHDTEDVCENLLLRTTLPAHVSASGIVVAKGKLLMVLHPYLHVWLQPGGHIEPGESPLQSAMREVREETAVDTEPHPWQLRHPIPIDIDIHRIAANPMKDEPEHWHFDLRYLLDVRQMEARLKPEVDVDLHSIRWSSIAALAAMDAKLSPGLGRLLGKLDSAMTVTLES